jgi:hypothetical protein
MLAGRRPNPDQTRVNHRLRELGVLRQEPIARMDRLRARGERSGDDLLAHKVALTRRRRPDMHRLIGLPHMQRLGVGIRIDRDRADTHLARRADNPAGNLAAIGDEEGFDHQYLRWFRHPELVSGSMPQRFSHSGRSV